MQTAGAGQLPGGVQHRRAGRPVRAPPPLPRPGRPGHDLPSGLNDYVHQEPGILFDHRQRAEHFQGGRAAVPVPALPEPVPGQAGGKPGGGSAGPLPLPAEAHSRGGAVPRLFGAAGVSGPAAGQRPAGFAEQEAAPAAYWGVPLAGGYAPAGYPASV